MDLYVVRTKTGNSQPMPREEAIQKARDYEENGVMAYVITEKAAKKLKEDNFNASMWA